MSSITYFPKAVLIIYFCFFAMAGEGPANMITRQVTDDLISFSGETAPPRFMKFFLVQKVAESHSERGSRRSPCLLATKDAKRSEEAKLVALNDVIAEALDKIKTLKNNVKILGCTGDDIDLCLDVGCGCCPPLSLVVFVIYGPFFILEKLGEVVESPPLPNNMKVTFDQACKEEASFAALMHELYCSLRVSLSKNRLAPQLEVQRARRCSQALENMKEIVARDSMMLGDLEQLLARAQVRVDFKYGYLADVEEKVYVFVWILDFFRVYCLGVVSFVLSEMWLFSLDDV
nr:hypothetical protein [Tanacetum cinerariifolium]